MKRNYLLTALILIFVVSLFGCSTTSNERKARSVIRNEIKASLDSESKYEQMSFSVLDSLFTSPAEIEEYRELHEKFAYYDKMAKERMRARESHTGIDEPWAVSRRNLYLQQAREFQDSARMYKPALDSIIGVFVPEFAGWTMSHTYRIIKGREETVLRKRFTIDREISKVVNEEEMPAN